MHASSSPRPKQLTAGTKYEILREISFRIRNTFDLNEILNHLLDTVATVIPYDAAGIFVLSQDVIDTPYHAARRVISGIVQRGFDERPPETDPMLTSGKGIVGAVIAAGEPVVLGDVRRDQRYLVGRARTLSEIAVPIFRNNRSIGALNVESDRLDAFSAEDLEILTFLADAASISIEKSLQHVQILEKKRIEDQLRTAREVQERLLPAEPPRIRGYEIAGVCIPTFEIGGDYFDYLPLEKHQLGVVIADVAGNGIAAALLMMAFRALLMAHASAGRDPASTMEMLNRYMPEFARRKDFITAIYGVLDTRAHTFTFANAGHYPPLLVHSAGDLETLDPVGPGLNIVGGATYRQGTVTLAPQDTVVLYTDGAIDVFSASGEDFGIERLKNALRSQAHRSPQELIRQIVSATEAFSGSNLHRDDFTVVAFRRMTPAA